jgi:cellulose synthase operon protein C
MANGGHGARDGGKTRSLLLRRAAMLASDELGDLERALGWLADALIAYVDDDVLRVLVEIAASAGDYSKADGVLERARAEVFDGPMVRKILTCRADLREHNLNDKKGAAKDLKRLLDLAPGDTEVSERLSQLFSEMGDYRGMIQLYEDQILRGRDKERRADLARRVAILWQEEVNDPREAADAWRRVLRMKGGDTEAKERLAQAKEAMLKSRSRQAENAELSASPTQAAMADPEPENSSASPTQAAMADPEPENSSAEVGGETPAPQAQEVPQAAEEHAGGDEWTAATEVTDKPLPPSVPSPGAEASKLSSPPDPARVLGGRPSLVPLRPPSAPPPLGPSPSASSTPLPTAGEPPPEAPASAPGVPQQSPDESAAQSVELEASEFTESEFDETRVDLDRGAHLPGAVQTPPARVPADAAARQPTDGPSPPPRRQAPGGVERSVAPPLPPRRASSRRPAPPPPPGRRAKS